jgi:hypothetical protein
MGFSYRRRIPLGKHLGLNISTRGVTVSERIGRVTVSSRGRMSVRLGHGLSYRRRFF